MCFKIMFVNRIAFAVSISHAFKVNTTEAIANWESQTVLAAIKNIAGVYAQQGFTITSILSDSKFEPLCGTLSMLGIILNTAARDEHMPKIKQHIQTLKEQCCAIYNSLPFKTLPIRMMVELVYSMTFWLHAFPANNGILATISPRELIMGMRIDCLKHCMLPFGAYMQTHEQHDNSMAPHTIGAIALHPTGN